MLLIYKCKHKNYDEAGKRIKKITVSAQKMLTQCYFIINQITIIENPFKYFNHLFTINN